MFKTKLINILLLIIVFMLVVSIIRSYTQLGQKAKTISDTEKKIVEVEQRHKDLTRDLARVESKDYVERQARDKLNLGKEGEVIIILPTITPGTTPTPIPSQGNWEKWLRLFIQ